MKLDDELQNPCGDIFALVDKDEMTADSYGRKTVVDVPVVLQRQPPVIRRVRKTVEVPQVQYADEIIDVSVVTQRSVPTIQAVPKTEEVPQVQFSDRVADVIDVSVPLVNEEISEVAPHAPQERVQNDCRVLIMDDCNELIPEWLNFVKGVVDSEDIPLNVCRETLLQNKILRVIKKNHLTKYLETLAEIAELNDDSQKSYEQRGKCWNHEDSTVGVNTAEMLRFNTSKPGDEQVSFEEYVDRMNEGQDNIYGITGESIADVSSRKKGHEVLYVADPVDEYAVQLLEEFEMKLKTTAKEGLDLGVQDERKTLNELNMMKETLGDKVDEVNVSNRMVDSLRALTKSEHG